LLFALLIFLAPESQTRAAGTYPVPGVVSAALTHDRVVALTFDDGPSAFTSEILTELHTFHAHATFFLVGVHIAAYRSVVWAEVRAHNEIGNHTFFHADLLWLDNADVLSELSMTQEAARSASGVAPGWFRPPYGAVDARITALAASLGLRTVTWSVDPTDWSRPGVAAIVARVLFQVRPGSVILLHDGGGDRSETVAALSYLLPALHARGYRIVTVSHLFFPPPAHGKGGCGRRPCGHPEPARGAPPPMLPTPTPAAVSCTNRGGPGGWRHCP
jgi:peptidoglycan/xylan/chitin deacetylase (PgdA/CDA1 family)